MRIRVHRLISALSICLAGSLSIASAQPKPAPKQPAPKPAPAEGEPKAKPPKAGAPKAGAPKAGAKAGAKDAPKADPKADAKDAPKADAKAGAKDAPKAGAKADPKAGAKAGAKDAPKADAPKDDAAAAAPVEPEPEPPSDLDGRGENPDAPTIVGDEPAPAIIAPLRPKRSGYPIEEAARPITLPKNTSEVSIDPHMQVDPHAGSTALRARYGITEKIQLGLTYLIGGTFDDPATPATDTIGFKPGKAVGLDLTVMLKSWVGVRLGVPFYIDPLAVSITVGAPMKWQFADGKYAIGAFDEVLTIKVKRFAPSFYQEARNALAADGTDDMGTNTVQSDGSVRLSAFGVAQYSPELAIIGRLGLTFEDFSTTKTDAAGTNPLSFIRAGIQYTPRKYIDLGLSIGFDDLSELGSFGPAGLLAFRI